jgi:hypothetical protein
LKVWELEEGKIYKSILNYTFKLESGVLKSPRYNDDGSINHWYENQDTYNSLKELNFTEVVDTNSHWCPKPEEDYIYIGIDYDEIIEDVDCSKKFIGSEYSNQFHPDDKKKVECLALETRIKSTIINWRRLHDDVELDWEDGNAYKYFIDYHGIDEFINTYSSSNYLGNLLGYFSSEEKALQFYEYMKQDIDKYFEMRKELKF